LCTRLVNQDNKRPCRFTLLKHLILFNSTCTCATYNFKPRKRIHICHRSSNACTAVSDNLSMQTWRYHVNIEWHTGVYTPYVNQQCECINYSVSTQKRVPRQLQVRLQLVNMYDDVISALKRLRYKCNIDCIAQLILPVCQNKLGNKICL